MHKWQRHHLLDNMLLARGHFLNRISGIAFIRMRPGEDGQQADKGLWFSVLYIMHSCRRLAVHRGAAFPISAGPTTGQDGEPPGCLKPTSFRWEAETAPQEICSWILQRSRNLSPVSRFRFPSRGCPSVQTPLHVQLPPTPTPSLSLNSSLKVLLQKEEEMAHMGADSYGSPPGKDSGSSASQAPVCQHFCHCLPKIFLLSYQSLLFSYVLGGNTVSTLSFLCILVLFYNFNILLH